MEARRGITLDEFNAMSDAERLRFVSKETSMWNRQSPEYRAEIQRGRSEERARCAAILTCVDVNDSRYPLALELATKTDVTAEDAQRIVAAAPRAKSGSGLPLGTWRDPAETAASDSEIEREAQAILSFLPSRNQKAEERN